MLIYITFSSIQDKTETIGSYQKQLAAYAGDTSEEAQTGIQQIKVSLEEAQQDLADTEYDQWLNDQEHLMDDLYSEYETLLNQRLDNLDSLIQDMIGQTNDRLRQQLRQCDDRCPDKYRRDLFIKICTLNFFQPLKPL